MSLQVWLPLNGDLHNQGLTNIEIVNNGNVSVDNNGKIGKCYQFDTNKYLKIIDYATTFLTYDTWSLSLWFKCTAQNTSHSGSALISGGNWNKPNELLNLALGNFSTDHYTKLLISGSGSWANGYSYNFYLNTWYHVVLTSGNGAMRAYVNGILIGDSYAAFKPLNLEQSWVCIGNGTYSQYFHFKGLMNDIRIYDHCLSAAEVAEIAKGLVLHYKLDQNLNILDNCYSYPTFNTSSAGGGWSHWGSTGHQGTYGQNTNKNFIYHKQNTYSHWWANGSTATSNYLLYQSPAFEGGIRSLQAILKEENSQPITESICFPAWNARNGGALANKWTDIISLGNGFYLCKCEGISQDGSNDLVGIHVKPGYKVYISEAYLENNREICSDIFNQNNSTTIYDCSGYSNNGTIIGNLTAAAGSPRYEIATQFPGSAAIKFLDFNLGNIWSAGIWFKSPSTATQTWSSLFTVNNNGGDADLKMNIYYQQTSGTSQFSANGQYTTGVTGISKDQWHHIMEVFNGSTLYCYLDGILKTTKTITNAEFSRKNLVVGARSSATNGSTTSAYFNGQLSDFRIYATALTAEQVADLFHTSATIDASGNIYARELKEI